MLRIATWKLFLLFLLLCIVLGFLLAPRKASAQQNFSSGNTTTLQKSQTINEDYFSAGGNTVIIGTVNGDVYAAGGTVFINGLVNGDVLAAGGNVTIDGKVTGNVRVTGGQILLTGSIGKNVTMAGGSVVVGNGAQINGSLTAVGGNISVLAPIGKGMTVAANNVQLSAPIGGNVTAAVQSLGITNEVRIGGSLNYWSNTKAQIPQHVAVKGIIYHHTNYSTEQKQQKGIFTGFTFFWDSISLVSALIMGIVLLWLVPLYMRNITSVIHTRLGLSFLTGLVVIILMPIACVVLLITIIGIPFALILLGVFSIFIFFNKIFISYAIGKKLLPAKTVLSLLIGLLIYGIMSIIPILGSIWGLVSLCIGIGAFLMMGKSIYIQARIKKLL